MNQILHTATGPRPFWYHLERHDNREVAIRRANQYALDHGGYVAVIDWHGNVVFGTDPVSLDRAIEAGRNRDFIETA